jgi:hypothetical protein
LLRISGIQQVDPLDATTEVKEVLKGGFKNVLEKYDAIHTDYISSMQESNINNGCLACGKVEKLLRCSKCKKVYFCNKVCQASCNMFHAFDCK